MITGVLALAGCWRIFEHGLILGARFQPQPGAGRCGLITGAATVVASSMRTFPIEYGLPESK